MKRSIKVVKIKSINIAKLVLVAPIELSAIKLCNQFPLKASFPVENKC